MPSPFDRRLLWILLVAFLARIGPWIWFQEIGPGTYDETEYDRIATNLVHHGEFSLEAGRPTSLRPPLYPFVVGVIYRVTGIANYQAVRLLQILLNLGTGVLVWSLGRRMYDERTALWGATIALFYPSLWGHDYLILTEVLFTLLLCAATLALVSFFGARRWGPLLAGGILMGLATLTRSPFQLFPALFAALVLFGWRVVPVRRRAAATVVFCAAFALPVAPWIARNTLLHGTLSPVDSTGTRLYERFARPRLRSMAGRSYDRPRYDRLGTLPRLTVNSLKLWQPDRELVGAAVKGWYGPIPRAGILAMALFIPGYYIVFILLGVFGLWLTPPADRLQLAVVLCSFLVVMSVHALVVGHSRYHIPLMPFVALFAGRLLTVRPRLRDRPGRLLGAALTATVLIGSWIAQLVAEDLPDLMQGLGQMS